MLAAFTATGRPRQQPRPTASSAPQAAIPIGCGLRLTKADLLAFTPGGEIRAAYPFSPAPTPIRVAWDGGPQVHAMCAIDALGMSAMLGRPVTITAAEPDTGRPVTVTIAAAQARWAPRTAVVFVGEAGDTLCSWPAPPRDNRLNR